MKCNAIVNVALVEKEHLGGTCINTGCTPTKTMVASAATQVIENFRGLSDAEKQQIIYFLRTL